MNTNTDKIYQTLILPWLLHGMAVTVGTDDSGIKYDSIGGDDISGGDDDGSGEDELSRLPPALGNEYHK